MFASVWNKLAREVDASLQQVGVAMVLMLSGVALLSFLPLPAIYLFLTVAATFVIRRFHVQGALLSIAIILLFSGIVYFSHPEKMTLWQGLWTASLCLALYVVAGGYLSTSEENSAKERALKQEAENSALWKARFETLQQQLQREKDKVSSLESDMIVLEEKHEERIEALKQLIELTSSESARERYRLEKLVEERDALQEKTHTLLIEIDGVKGAVQQQEEPLFTEEEALRRLKELNEVRFENFQLHLLLTQYRKEQKIQEKVKRERAPRSASASMGQEKITLQDLAKVISKNIK